ncbi:MAG: hypothetical protein AAFR96_05035 [Planctomycetota bacterium]
MSPEKLLELALLDAGGVLDRHESDEFESAFAEASPEIKAQVRREQSRFADLTEILPDVSPRPELKSLVLDAVRDASHTQRDAVGRAIVSHEASARREATRRTARRTARRANAWRVATFAFATGFAATGLMAFQLNQEFEDVSDSIAANDGVSFFLENADRSGFRAAVIDDSFERAALTPTQPASDITVSSDAGAAVFYSAATGEGFLTFRDLPQIEPTQIFALVVLDDDGNVTNELTRFPSVGETNVIAFEYDASMGAGFAVAVASPDGQLDVVLQLA